MKKSARWKQFMASFSRSTKAIRYAFCLALLVISGCAPVVQMYSLGVGVYPGDPTENFSPTLVIDSTHYRNLALLRPVYQSSAYDYNLTGQLITDGIIDTTMPGWIVVTTSQGVLDKKEREWVLDRHEASTIGLDSSKAWIQVQMAGDYQVPAVDSLSMSGTVVVDTLQPCHWEITVEGSYDGVKWNSLGIVSGDRFPGIAATELASQPLPEKFGVFYGFGWKNAPGNIRVFNYSFETDSTVHYKFYRLDLNSPSAKRWDIGIFGLYHNGHFAPIGGPYDFTSAWKSASSGKEWVYVDLGAECSFNDVKLFWIRPAVAGSIQVSDDASNWKGIAPLPNNGANDVDIRLDREVKARYVRVLMTTPANKNDGYILSELEVLGTGGPLPVQHPQAPIDNDGKMSLSGGAWRLQRASLVHFDGAALSKLGFDDSGWLIATVPGTVLTSYLNDGAIPNPDFGDNQVLISDSYFYSDFWYRDVFTPPASYHGHRTYLNFDGINWKAVVYLNGHELGRIDGAFIRGRFDVTDILKPGAPNVLAVLVIKNAHPGFATEQDRYNTDANGGQLCEDSPTFSASVGWDWIPTIRGRNTGIWSDVYLSKSGPVTIRDPFVSTTIPLPDTTSADINIVLTLHNHARESIRGTLRGRFGKVEFQRQVTLNSLETKEIIFSPSTDPQLKLRNPKLWWPNGYGEQNLYKVNLEFIADGKLSDSKSFNTGIREVSYSENGGALRIWVNGRRLIALGGNWGFPESMLRYRAREYDVAVRYHKDMNFTMIRDWVGQTEDDAFYDACDKYGIMVWQDLWLANPADGPNPGDPQMFIRNFEDFVKRIRNHPCIALYVGRNEGDPPPVIDSALVSDLRELDPGIKYIPNSASGLVSGHGPYKLMPVRYYFQDRATKRLHSEMGLPAIVSYASLKQMIPIDSLWPQTSLWGVHDFTLGGAQNGASFNRSIEENFGDVDSLQKWLWLADWTEYNAYRAMFEAQSRNRMGLLIWMSHPSWPSLTWQTYDYYFDPTAAYFGCKEACEPLHIQWNAYTDSIEIVNYSVPDASDLIAIMRVMNLSGRVILKEKEVDLSCPEDSTISLFPVVQPQAAGRVSFISLELRRGSKLISRNLYWWKQVKDSMKFIMHLPKVHLASHTSIRRSEDRWYLTTVVSNDTKYIAPIVKLTVVGDKDGRRILPVIYSDNFITLLPGEERTIKMELSNADTRGERPRVVVEGLNVE